MASRRFTSCSADISSEKKATLLSPRTAMLYAMVSASADLPMEGRAAKSIRSDF